MRKKKEMRNQKNTGVVKTNRKEKWEKHRQKKREFLCPSLST